jgi:hypothetical protein
MGCHHGCFVTAIEGRQVLVRAEDGARQSAGGIDDADNLGISMSVIGIFLAVVIKLVPLGEARHAADDTRVTMSVKPSEARAW